MMENRKVLSFGEDADASRAFLLEHGRIRKDEKKQALWFNWTGAGFSFRFEGTVLKARLFGYAEPETAPFDLPFTLMYPVVGTHTDGGELVRYKLADGEQELTLFEGAKGEHQLTLRKLSENVMGKCALLSLETDGCFLAPPKAKALKIEFAGDSITCGYGNEAKDPMGLRTEDENAESTYAYLAAKALDAEYSAVCVSGCAVTEPFPDMENRGMDTLYACTDLPFERAFKNEEAEAWDFAAHKNDVVVINLGTNDQMVLSMQGFSKEADMEFHRNYRALLEQIREKNGKDTLIVSTLGPMGYYLWDEIRDIVKKYAEETGDGRIVCFKYGQMNIMSEGTGADGHPSANTHARMARELAEFLKTQELK